MLLLELAERVGVGDCFGKEHGKEGEEEGDAEHFGWLSDCDKSVLKLMGTGRRVRKDGREEEKRRREEKRREEDVIR